MRTSLDVCTRLIAAGLATGLFGATFIGSIGEALAECKPGHFKPPYFIKTMGPCGFDSETLSFRGTPAQQAMCLMRGMDTTRNLGPTLEGLPPGLAKRVGETTGLPSREVVERLFVEARSGMGFRRLSVATDCRTPTTTIPMRRWRNIS